MFRLWFGMIILLFPIYASGIQLVIPINEQKQFALAIKFPNNFKPIQNFKNQNLNNKELFFLPVNNGKINKNEIILMIPKLNSDISAIDFIDKFTEQFKKTTQKMSILKEEKKEYDGFVHVARLIMYEYKNEVEIINLYAVSGPKNLVFLQYSIKIQNNNQVKPAINKILTFFNQEVQVRRQEVKEPKIRLKDAI